MTRFLSVLSAPRRHPLFTGLVAALAGCVLSTGITLLGGLEALRQFEGAFAPMLESCALASPTPATGPCDELKTAYGAIDPRLSIVLLMQGLCLALMVGGSWLIIGRAHRALVRKPQAALELAPFADLPNHDEIDRLVNRVAQLAARQVGYEAEGRWGQQLVNERVRRNAQALQTLHQVARTYSDADVSEFSLLNALSLLESALGARTVAVGLSGAARAALGAAAVVSTHGEPALAARLSIERAATDTSARLVPAGDDGGQTLVVPLARGDLSFGTLVAEFPAQARIDDLQTQLAESFANLTALAISTVSRSLEERRVALMEERSAIAAELHDSLAQSLAFMRIQVARLQGGLDLDEQSPVVTQAADELRAGLSTAYREVRELIAAFRVRMGPGGLLVAVREAVDEFSQRSALEISFEADMGRCHLQVNEEFHVLQVIREALSNAVQHARAQRVWIRLRYGPTHQLVATIEDDGRGLVEPDDDDVHYGLGIMRERAGTLAGEVRIGPRPGGGTRVCLSFAPERVPTDVSDATPTIETPR